MVMACAAWIVAVSLAVILFYCSIKIPSYLYIIWSTPILVCFAYLGFKN